MVSKPKAHDHLESLFQDAFPPTSLDSIQLFGANRGATYFAGNNEAEAFEALINGKTWKTVDVDSLDRDHDLLFFLTPEGFVQLLPAFALAAATRFEKFDRLAELISTLLTRNASDPGKFDERVSAMTAQQRVAVTNLLEHLEVLFSKSWQLNPAQVALDSFWRNSQSK
jgi:hypothetical protein